MHRSPSSTGHPVGFTSSAPIQNDELPVSTANITSPESLGLSSQDDLEATELAATIPQLYHSTQSFTQPVESAYSPHSQFTSGSSAQETPSTSCDEFDNYSYHDSPAMGQYSNLPINVSSVRSTAASPTGWSSPDAQQVAAFQPVSHWKDGESAAMISYDIQINSSAQPQDPYFTTQLASSSASDAGSAALGPVSAAPGSILLNQSPSSHYPTYSLDPREVEHEPEHGLKMESADSDVEDGRRQERLHSSESDQGRSIMTDLHQEHPAASAEEGKNDPAYAQLIYQAFLSKEDHILTLQEIYQWFRDNTDKEKQSRTKDNRNGWMNSIRHNLSMNQAFEKRVSKNNPSYDATEARRNTEWMLTTKALNEGVLATTRYRKKTKDGDDEDGQNNSGCGRRRGSPANSARAVSGRRGGISASRSRATRRSRGLQSRIKKDRNERRDFPVDPAMYMSDGMMRHPMAQSSLPHGPVHQHQPAYAYAPAPDYALASHPSYVDYQQHYQAAYGFQGAAPEQHSRHVRPDEDAFYYHHSQAPLPQTTLPSHGSMAPLHAPLASHSPSALQPGETPVPVFATAAEDMRAYYAQQHQQAPHPWDQHVHPGGAFHHHQV